jgi:hypothetical protein
LVSVTLMAFQTEAFQTATQMVSAMADSAMVDSATLMASEVSDTRSIHYCLICHALLLVLTIG